MTERRTLQLERKALRLIKQPGSVMVDLTIRPDGHAKRHYLYLPVSVNVQAEPTGDCQWMGVHDCMCVTIRRPIQWTNLLKVARGLPIIEPFGIVTWLGALTHHLGDRISKKGTLFSILGALWDPPEPVHFKTKGIIHPVLVGSGGFVAHILEIPAIQRERVVPEYIEEL